MINIYAYENNINGKVYIGQTVNLAKRDSYHSHGHGVKYHSHLDKAIIKYGRANFTFWTVIIVETQDQANQEEIYWIARMRECIGYKMVYNISDGGNDNAPGWLGKKRSPETIAKISASTKGKKRPWVANANRTRRAAHIASFNHKGKTWTMVNGKRKWSSI